jgi:hypothetical protein
MDAEDTAGIDALEPLVKARFRRDKRRVLVRAR